MKNYYNLLQQALIVYFIQLEDEINEMNSKLQNDQK